MYEFDFVYIRILVAGFLAAGNGDIWIYIQQDLDGKTILKRISEKLGVPSNCVISLRTGLESTF
jgi:hypothetical protein